MSHSRTAPESSIESELRGPSTCKMMVFPIRFFTKICISLCTLFVSVSVSHGSARALPSCVFTKFCIPPRASDLASGPRMRETQALLLWWDALLAVNPRLDVLDRDRAALDLHSCRLASVPLRRAGLDRASF